ncbi:coiled-coil-helix-coiled-coil-helix domain-containing protein C550.01c [Colletotrichum liriopes]|uniref:Coiled-coil-helix-coiled-coil-helix domain-containing protein C550.01c n=1 Tax=Colletotrichum liriopes TaxID=708192 RepID=A0AA37LZ60_9PEZI|nr:coiled-coil-helix-coiled-coil-helix domain-containing protein C550.01c [Colletotrichum liriopes]
MSKQESDAAQKAAMDEDEPDEWYVDQPELRPYLPKLGARDVVRKGQEENAGKTGAKANMATNDYENTKLTDCYFEKKDWRQCTAEMERFKSCWKQQGNDHRTDMKDA